MRIKKPEYLILYEYLRDEIVKGAWPCGARLPSRRQTAVDRGLSAITVEHSYELLCQEGYVEARPRSGYYVVYRQSDGFAAYAQAVEAIGAGEVHAASAGSVIGRILGTIVFSPFLLIDLIVWVFSGFNVHIFYSWLFD